MSLNPSSGVAVASLSSPQNDRRSDRGVVSLEPNAHDVDEDERFFFFLSFFADFGVVDGLLSPAASLVDPAAAAVVDAHI